MTDTSTEPRVSARSFTRIPTVMTAQEIVDSAFRRASKISVPDQDAFMRMKGTESARVRHVQNAIASTLLGYVKRFPSFDGLSPFYQELLAILLDMDATRKSLAALQWAAKQVEGIGDEAVKDIKRAPYAEKILEAKSHAYGRISSILKQVDADLRALDESRQTLRKLPLIEARTLKRPTSSARAAAPMTAEPRHLASRSASRTKLRYRSRYQSRPSPRRGRRLSRQRTGRRLQKSIRSAQFRPLRSRLAYS